MKAQLNSNLFQHLSWWAAFEQKSTIQQRIELLTMLHKALSVCLVYDSAYISVVEVYRLTGLVHSIERELEILSTTP